MLAPQLATTHTAHALIVQTFTSESLGGASLCQLTGNFQIEIHVVNYHRLRNNTSLAENW